MIQIDGIPASHGPQPVPPATASIGQAADAILAQYRTSPITATERAIAMLALWATDAIAAGRLAPLAADATFTHLFVEISNPPAGPETSDDADQLLLECMSLHDWGTEFSADLAEIRRLAFVILGQRGHEPQATPSGSGERVE